MRKVLQKMQPSRALLPKLLPVFTALIIGVLGYVVGRYGFGAVRANHRTELANLSRTVSDNASDKRHVAYIYDNIPITREELGEFLIARFGADRLDFLVQRRIVDLACKSRGIDITDAQIDAQLDEDLKHLSPNGNMTRKDFTNQVLRRFNKSLYEWKEDVIRPKLMLAALVGTTIKVTDEDVRKAFEGRYGPRVDCRMIVLQDTPQKYQIWAKVKDSEAEFSRVARTLNMPQLAAVEGKVPPIHKYFGDNRVEEAAFKLKEGEVSGLIEMSDDEKKEKTVIILKCDRRIPADYLKRLEDERLALMREIESQKLAESVQAKLTQLRQDAHPKLLLRNEARADELERPAVPEIRSQMAVPPPRLDVPPVPKTGG